MPFIATRDTAQTPRSASNQAASAATQVGARVDAGVKTQSTVLKNPFGNLPIGNIVKFGIITVGFIAVLKKFRIIQ